MDEYFPEYRNLPLEVQSLILSNDIRTARQLARDLRNITLNEKIELDMNLKPTRLDFQDYMFNVIPMEFIVIRVGNGAEYSYYSYFHGIYKKLFSADVYSTDEDIYTILNNTDDKQVDGFSSCRKPVSTSYGGPKCFRYEMSTNSVLNGVDNFNTPMSTGYNTNRYLYDLRAMNYIYKKRAILFELNENDATKVANSYTKKYLYDIYNDFRKDNSITVLLSYLAWNSGKVGYGIGWIQKYIGKSIDEKNNIRIKINFEDDRNIIEDMKDLCDQLYDIILARYS